MLYYFLVFTYMCFYEYVLQKPYSPRECLWHVLVWIYNRLTNDCAKIVTNCTESIATYG
jgi:hypothetical protein